MTKTYLLAVQVPDSFKASSFTSVIESAIPDSRFLNFYNLSSLPKEALTGPGVEQTLAAISLAIQIYRKAIEETEQPPDYQALLVQVYNQVKAADAPSKQEQGELLLPKLVDLQEGWDGYVRTGPWDAPHWIPAKIYKDDEETFTVRGSDDQFYMVLKGLNSKVTPAFLSREELTK